MQRLALLLLGVAFVFSGCDKFKPDRAANQLAVGASAHDLLSADKFKRLVVEIHYVDGFQPEQGAINNLETFLKDRLNKPGGISVIQAAIPSPEVPSYSVSDLTSIEDQNRSSYNSDTTISIYFLVTDERFVGDNNDQRTLGVAYRNTSMALFGSTIREFSDGAFEPSRTKLETTIFQHEIGHILGLVNNGTDMEVNHQDVDHGHHCNVESCLMYFAVETDDIVSTLFGGSIPQLDDKCLADLRANGGK